MALNSTAGKWFYLLTTDFLYFSPSLPRAFSQENMTFDHFATYSPLEVKFLHLQNHSHHWRGANRASNSQEGVRVLEYKNAGVVQVPLVI